MSTLQRRLALRYGLIVSVCLLALAWLSWHEFVQEPRQFRELGIQEPVGGAWAEVTEVFLYAGVPALFIFGWWFVRRSLKPLHDLARSVEEFHPRNLAARLPRTGNGDEVDRVAAAFNSMAERLEGAFRQIHDFTLHASHELKTPLTIMRIQLETMLRDEGRLSPQQVEWLECELNEVQRLSRIVDALNLLTKADAGLVELARQPVPLHELVRECFEDARILAEPHAVRVALLSCEDVLVPGDRDRLRQLLLNLTDNAIKYNHPGGSVSLTLRRDGDRAELAITNTGAGIPPELRERVFERFVRGEEARSRAIEGSGLGLSICRWIVQAHGGTIALLPGHGGETLACVRLPTLPAA